MQDRAVGEIINLTFIIKYNSNVVTILKQRKSNINIPFEKNTENTKLE